MEGDGPSGPPKRAVHISVSLIARRNLSLPPKKQNPKDVMEALLALWTVRLDRENLCALENLECLGAVHSLYLQDNQIQKIENLEFLSTLRFLVLARNRICKVENLKLLPRLGFLDLSDNRIDQLDTGELPSSLVIVNLTGNKCTDHERYRERVVEALPLLQELDGQRVRGRRDSPEDEEEGDESDSETEEPPTEIFSILSTRTNFFAGLHQEMFRRSERRMKEVLRHHEARMDELKELQKHVSILRNLQLRGKARTTRPCNHLQKDPAPGIQPGPGPGRLLESKIGLGVTKEFKSDPGVPVEPTFGSDVPVEPTSDPGRPIEPKIGSDRLVEPRTGSGRPVEPRIGLGRPGESRTGSGKHRESKNDSGKPLGHKSPKLGLTASPKPSTISSSVENQSKNSKQMSKGATTWKSTSSSLQKERIPNSSKLRASPKDRGMKDQA
ncbi:leucine-rich repeat-containing protein 46 [Latimeria chalumnae]|uniref:Leucine rich repeat containing 46 n=1 Tax=Latimeria chalumnae TaxID=7897 RepID=M3XK60_LATCH|nr:PREDICTED: leucine-rich repeat-containing protein 46 [Latimeria chalumnae]|eukprot:XP_014340557.1 PREDICTED: leucine-rich repeat-containing protein 46 [Latimeria chalumnae]